MNLLSSRPVLYTVVAAGLVLAGARIYTNTLRSAAEMVQPPAPPAPDKAIDDFIRFTEVSLMAGDFERLEQEAKADRDVNVRFAGGYPKLRYFYRALGSYGRYNNCGCGRVMYFTDLTFGQKLHALRTWQAERPGSIAALIAEAELWSNLAWHARGHDFADKTPPDHMDLFQERFMIAARALRGLDPLTDPFIDDIRLGLTRGISDSLDSFTTIFAQAVHASPTYFFYYGAMAGLLEPRWFGREGGLASYLKALSGSGGNTGLIIYSFAAEALLADYESEDLFTKTGLDWPTLKRAFSLRKDRYGSSLKVLNVELEFAAAAGDREYASQLLMRIGTKWDPNAWTDWNSFSKVANWAGQPSEHEPVIR